MLIKTAADRLKALRAGAAAGWPDIQGRYGQALLAGDGCEADPREALRWFITAAHADHPEAKAYLIVSYFLLHLVKVNVALQTYCTLMTRNLC